MKPATSAGAGFLKDLGRAPATGDVLAALREWLSGYLPHGRRFILLGLLLLMTLRGDDVSSIDAPSPSPLDA